MEKREFELASYDDGVQHVSNYGNSSVKNEACVWKKFIILFSCTIRTTNLWSYPSKNCASYTQIITVFSSLLSSFPFFSLLPLSFSFPFSSLSLHSLSFSFFNFSLPYLSFSFSFFFFIEFSLFFVSLLLFRCLSFFLSFSFIFLFSSNH